MSKTLTTYEALKANETKRVRGVNAPKNIEGYWFGVRELIEHCNRGGLMEFDAHRYLEWEAEEPLIEWWGLAYDSAEIFSFHSSEADAKEYHKHHPKARIVHLREVWS